MADAYQGSGLGSLVMRSALALARRLGRTQMILMGGVQAGNARAVHFYEKAGFRRVGSFTTRMENFDMILDLT